VTFGGPAHTLRCAFSGGFAGLADLKGLRQPNSSHLGGVGRLLDSTALELRNSWPLILVRFFNNLMALFCPIPDTSLCLQQLTALLLKIWSVDRPVGYRFGPQAHALTPWPSFQNGSFVSRLVSPPPFVFNEIGSFVPSKKLFCCCLHQPPQQAMLAPFV
jgi:hypothetical protein